MFQRLAKVLALAGIMVLGAGAAHAQVKLQGAGASFPNPLYQKWITAYNEGSADTKVDYQSVGSGGGIKQITAKTVQFAGSDAPLTADQEKAAAGILHLPTVAGPVVLTYNIAGLNDPLILDGETTAGIFLGEIKTWNDPRLVKLNPSATLPASPIITVHRSDSSGTTFIFTSYLAAVSKDWADKFGAHTEVTWPGGGQGGAKSDGVAAAVKQTPGSIGYVELGYAEQGKLPFATQINKDGKPVRASLKAVEAAAAKGEFPASLQANIVNAPGAESYPIAGYTYLLVYGDLSFMSKEQATALVKFLAWCDTEGQDMANASKYARLPKEVADKVLERIKSIKYNGEALVK